MSIRFRTVCAAAALAPLALLAACGSSGSTASSSSAAASAAPAASSGGGAATLSETGSTLMFPLFGAWQAAYATAVPTVTITSGGTGSGTGIADAATGTVTIGASDAYLSASQQAQYKGLINIPLTVAAVMVNYNVPGVTKPINLNGTVLAKIYSGKITTWNDKAITALNPGVSLPAVKIVTLHRADSSGSTFLFTSYLSDQDAAGWASSNVGTTITWPSAPGSLAETGSGGMVSGCGSTKGCLAYIGISYLAKTRAASLGEAALANKASKFVQPTSTAINAALATFSATTPATGSQSLIDTTAATGYPIINYEYAVVKKTQPSAASAAALKAFLKWTLTSGASSAFLSAVGFEPLPANVTTIAQNEISSIGG
ncbi:MAG: phosphate ABC transporter substrate-binding protein PstS [Actinomycetota bacterium]|nr:phosphate ABC transporter substrate-binding protein PstS [Actinomycetota bacterium]